MGFEFSDDDSKVMSRGWFGERPLTYWRTKIPRSAPEPTSQEIKGCEKTDEPKEFSQSHPETDNLAFERKTDGGL